MTQDDEIRIGEIAPQVIEFFREQFPDLPPLDEMALKMAVSPCSICGAGVANGQIGGFDPEYIDLETGTIYGDHVCLSCMEKGH